MTQRSAPDASAPVTIEAEAVLFGFSPTPAEVSIRPRAVAWRATRAAQMLGLFLVISPLVALVPPHAPWAIGALTTGVILARRRWSERFTLECVKGRCPKCEEPLDVKSGRLRTPHPVSCESCHHECSLRIPPGILEGPLLHAA